MRFGLHDANAFIGGCSMIHRVQNVALKWIGAKLMCQSALKQVTPKPAATDAVDGLSPKALLLAPSQGLCLKSRLLVPQWSAQNRPVPIRTYIGLWSLLQVWYPFSSSEPEDGISGREDHH
jgi:hypothetical protein